MGKGIVTQVVQEGGTEESFHTFQRQRSLLLLFEQLRDHSFGQVIDAKAMIETGMSGAGIDQICRPELLNPCEFLERRCMYNLNEWS